jgi:hypothetical protein
LLRRMESLKSRRRRQQNREGVVISGPQVESCVHFQKSGHLLDVRYTLNCLCLLGEES